MSLFNGPEEHAANPPETWLVVHVGSRWDLRPSESDYALQSYRTKREAVEAKSTGYLVDLYEKESRWYAGETINGWRSYGQSA